MVELNKATFERMVDALNAVHGRHEGVRAAHARGTCARGTFTATPAAKTLTRAPHMQGDPIPVTVRFSNGTGNPLHPDRRKDGRGMAVKFHLPSGKQTDMVGITLPVFFVKTADAFLELQDALSLDPATGKPDPARSIAFAQAHPEAVPGFQAVLTFEPPASYAQLVYRGLHAFKYVNAAGEQRFIRYRWEPEAGVASLTEDEAKALPELYLRDELEGRLKEGPVAFRLHVQIGTGEDATDDPTVPWPVEREDVDVGRLELREITDDCDEMLFDPTFVVDGIEVSDDEILRARSGAYAVSFKRRRKR
ncbi:MAG TPA: catalase family peroxidase [Actinomycetota bacterium]|nr:catalase family peroxidase [Actinomycetota bacterium]